MPFILLCQSNNLLICLPCMPLLWSSPMLTYSLIISQVYIHSFIIPSVLLFRAWNNNLAYHFLNTFSVTCTNPSLVWQMSKPKCNSTAYSYIRSFVVNVNMCPAIISLYFMFCHLPGVMHIPNPAQLV